MIRKHHSLVVADKVLRALNRIKLPGDITKTAHIGAFDNCREQGYCLTYWPDLTPLHVAFAENRNSDDIVVYCYHKQGFPSNMPAESEWNDKAYFRYDDHASAAAHIASRLIKHFKESKKEAKS